ncbi:MAG: MlaD family protein [Rikenellaceae bacterium]
MKKEIKIGIFTVLMIVGAWGGIRFLSGVDLFRRNSDYYVVYEQTNGLQKAAAIIVNGVKVGNVTDIRLSDDRRKVEVKLNISNKYQIPVDSEAKVFSSSLMGSKAIGLTLGESGEYLQSGDMITPTTDKDIMDMAGSELDFFKERIDMVTSELTRTLTNVNELLESNAQNINNTANNISSLSEQTTRMIDKNEERLSQIIESFAVISKGIGASVPQIDSIIGNLNSLTSKLDQADVANTIAQSLEEINTLMATLNDENGSINKLMSDSGLYDNVSSASGNLDALLVDFKENPWRYVNISVFGRNEQKQREKMEAQAERELQKANK